MVTVKMTESEYKAYLLWLKSIEIMTSDENDNSFNSSLEKYLEDPENKKELEAGIEDVKTGRVSFIDPENIWENIK